MNLEELKSNNNYPFKNFPGTVWYVAMGDGDVSGVMPLKKNNTGFYIDNYYISDDNPSVIDLLLDSVTEDMNNGKFSLTALVHKRHVRDFRRNHFSTIKELTNYDVMQYSLV